MSAKGTILVGTVGQGVMRSTNYGESWQRLSVGNGLHAEATVRCLATHPKQANVVYAGTDRGFYHSDDGGHMWMRDETPIGEQAVWSIAVDQANPERILAGVGTPDPGGIYMSTDSGARWRRSEVEVAETCAAVGTPRPLALSLDPTEANSGWAAFEVDGVRRTRDGGETWQKAAVEIKNPDVHCVLVSAGPPKTVFVLVNDDVWSSTDDGATWKPANARSTFPWHYVRHISSKPDEPSTVLVSVGDATPGRTGAIMRSTDAGQTWASLQLPAPPNSALWYTTYAPQEPGLVFAGSRYGNFYRSEDNGDSWERLWREFSEISSIAWLPE
jgi:photosystem II stability/assembly factor-like uncharacterized protein